MPLTLGTLSGEGERTPFALSYTDGFSLSVGGSGATVATASARNLGTAASDRVLIIGAGGGTDGYIPTEITAVTVGGVSATRLLTLSGNGPTSSYSAALFILPYPTGTSAVLTFTYAAAVPDKYLTMSIYAAYGMQSTTPVATDSAIYTSGTLTRNIRARSGGRIIGFNAGFLHLGSKTWTNLSINFNGIYGTSASAGFSRGQNVAVGYNGSGTDSAVVLASFA